MAVDDALFRYQQLRPPPAAVPPPRLIEHPVDLEQQPGESAQLGGALELKAPWLDP